MRIPARARIIAALAFGAACAACHHAPAPSTDGPSVGRAVGDPAFGMRILRISRSNTSATIAVGRPAYVALLAVQPGVTIEPIRMADKIVAAGTHTWDIPLEVAPAARQRQQGTVDQTALRRCVDAATRTRDRDMQPRVVRDTGGRVVGTAPPVGTNESLGAVEQRCRQQLGTRLDQQGQKRRAPWDLGAGYLLALASPTPLTRAEVYARLSSLTVKGDDVPALMAAIGDGLLAWRSPVWSGSYAAW